MDSFRLKNSLEYKQIVYKRNVINTIISKNGGFEKPYTGVLLQALSETLGTHFIRSYCELDPDKFSNFLNKKNEIARMALGDSSLKAFAADLNSSLEKDLDYFLAIFPYSIIESIVWECLLTDRSLASYRSPESADAIKASLERKKAEELYKKWRCDEAADLFKKAIEIYPSDFTVTFQLGLINFFEKADWQSSLECFKKSEELARDASPRFRCYSLCFSALITRLKALSESDAELAKNAGGLATTAVDAMPALIFPKYALLQTQSSLRHLNAENKSAIGDVKKIIDADHNMIIPIALDHAFDHFIDELSGSFVLKYDEKFKTCLELIKDVCSELASLPKKMESPAETAQAFNLQKEFKAVCERFKRCKTFMEISETTKRLKKIKECCDSIKLANQTLELFKRIKTYACKLDEEYKKDFSDRLAPYHEAQVRQKNILKTIENIYEKNFIASDEQCSDVNKFKKYKNSLRNINAISQFRSLCPLCVFLLMQAVITGLWLFAALYPFAVFVLISAINAFLVPLYILAATEAYYYFLDKKIDTLKKELAQIELKLTFAQSQPDEEAIKARAKYSRLIAQKFSISTLDATNIFESTIAGDFEKIKAIVKFIAARPQNDSKPEGR